MPETSTAQSLHRPVTELEAENSRLRKELFDAKLDVEVIRKTVCFCKGVAMKYAWIEHHHDKYTVSRLRRGLRSAYRQRKPGVGLLAHTGRAVNTAVMSTTS